MTASLSRVQVVEGREISVALVFEHETKGQRVLFGTGLAATHLAVETTRIGANRPFVVAGPRHEDVLARARLTDAVRYGWIVEHVPAEVAADARAAAHAADADLLIAIGGGSATGLAKAIALTSALPIIAVPTTFAGSEATDVWGVTENGRKRTGNDPRVLPAVVVYDADLFAGLPPSLAVASGLNAVAHAIDSMWAPRADPIDAALAMAGLRALRTGLPGVVAGDTDATEQTLFGSYLAAVAFASAGSGLHHKICHVLGGAFGLPHAPTHAIVLPHVLAFNAPFAATASARISAALGADDAPDGLHRLCTSIDAPTALREIGLREDDIEPAVALILPEVPPTNPRPVDAASLETVLRGAWLGSEPRPTGTEGMS
jgi:maleylacetate reductase